MAERAVTNDQAEFDSASAMSEMGDTDRRVMVMGDDELGERHGDGVAGMDAVMAKADGKLESKQGAGVGSSGSPVASGPKIILKVTSKEGRAPMDSTMGPMETEDAEERLSDGESMQIIEAANAMANSSVDGVAAKVPSSSPTPSKGLEALPKSSVTPQSPADSVSEKEKDSVATARRRLLLMSMSPETSDSDADDEDTNAKAAEFQIQRTIPVPRQSVASSSTVTVSPPTAQPAKGESPEKQDKKKRWEMLLGPDIIDIGGSLQEKERRLEDEKEKDLQSSFSAGGSVAASTVGRLSLDKAKSNNRTLDDDFKSKWFAKTRSMYKIPKRLEIPKDLEEKLLSAFGVYFSVDSGGEDLVIQELKKPELKNAILSFAKEPASNQFREAIGKTQYDAVLRCLERVVQMDDIAQVAGIDWRQMDSKMREVCQGPDLDTKQQHIDPSSQQPKSKPNSTQYMAKWEVSLRPSQG